MELPKCDFCSTSFPTWTHPSADFVLPIGGGFPAWGSADDAWAACEACHKLIMVEDRDGLARRSLAMLPGGVPNHIRPVMLAKITEMHAGFWANRNGEPVRQAWVAEAQHREDFDA